MRALCCRGRPSGSRAKPAPSAGTSKVSNKFLIRVAAEPLSFSFEPAPAPARRVFNTEQERRTVMRRIGLWALGIGVLVSVGPLAVERGYAGDHNSCTNTTLKGDYAFSVIDFVSPLVV